MKMDDFEKLFNGDLNDDEFRNEFVKLINQQKADFNNFIKSFYNDSLFNNKPFIGFFMDKEFNGLKPNTESGSDEFGNWEKQEWKSEDGSTSFTSFTRTYSDFHEKEDPIDILEYKMLLAIEEEKYEKAAEYRDAIKALQEKNKKK
jgi:hypothetical protein